MLGSKERIWNLHRGCVPWMAKEKGMEHLVDEGWQLVKWRLVGLTWTEVTLSQAFIDFQKNDFRGGVPRELDGIAAVEVFKDLGEGVGIMRPKEEIVIGKRS